MGGNLGEMGGKWRGKSFPLHFPFISLCFPPSSIMQQHAFPPHISPPIFGMLRHATKHHGTGHDIQILEIITQWSFIISIRVKSFNLAWIFIVIEICILQFCACVRSLAWFGHIFENRIRSYLHHSYPQPCTSAPLGGHEGVCGKWVLVAEVDQLFERYCLMYHLFDCCRACNT